MIIFNDGEIIDGFYKENKIHGPYLYIYPEGDYLILQFENGEFMSSKVFDPDGTLYEWSKAKHTHDDLTLQKYCNLTKKHNKYLIISSFKIF